MLSLQYRSKTRSLTLALLLNGILNSAIRPAKTTPEMLTTNRDGMCVVKEFLAALLSAAI